MGFPIVVRQHIYIEIKLDNDYPKDTDLYCLIDDENYYPNKPVPNPFCHWYAKESWDSL